MFDFIHSYFEELKLKTSLVLIEPTTDPFPFKRNSNNYRQYLFLKKKMHTWW